MEGPVSHIYVIFFTFHLIFKRVWKVKGKYKSSWLRLVEKLKHLMCKYILYFILVWWCQFKEPLMKYGETNMENVYS